MSVLGTNPFVVGHIALSDISRGSGEVGLGEYRSDLTGFVSEAS
jgi:hypothetical protein